MKFFLVNILVSLSIGFSYLLDGQPENTQNVTNELHKLQSEVSILKGMVTTLQESCHSCSALKKRPTPAFMATLTTENHACAIDAPLIFDRELLDTRMSYDVRHGIFRAPVNGTYVFTATLSAKPGKSVQVKMVKNFVTEEIGYILSPNLQSDWKQSTTTIVIQLAAGDDVWIACAGPAEIFGARYGTYDDFLTHFSGFLIDEA